MAINSTNINIGKIYSYFICSQSIDQNIFPEVLRSAQCYIALYPAPGESLGFVAVTIWFNPVALQVPGSEYLLDLMDHSMDNQTVCHFGERASWRVLPSLYVKGIVGRCRKKNRHIAIL
jgi:hypothetical protein